MISFHWLAWGSTCFIVSSLLLGWMAMRTGNSVAFRTIALGIAGGFTSCLAASALDGWVCSFANQWSNSLLGHWRLLSWSVGLREEGLKLLAAMCFFRRDLVSSSRLAEGLIGLATIGATFAAIETISYIPKGSSLEATAIIVAGRSFESVPLHAWCTVCEGCLLILARKNRYWLWALAIPAVAHSDFDYSFGISSPVVQNVAQTFLLAALGLSAIFLSSRILGKPSRTRWKATSLAIVIGCIPVLLISGCLGMFSKVGLVITLQPETAVFVLIVPWIIIVIDMLVRLPGAE